MCRCDIDDAAPFARLHGGDGGAHRVECRRQIDRDDLVPFLDRKFLDRRDILDARIIDEDVDRAESRLGHLHHVGDLGGFRQIGGRIEGFDFAFALDTGAFGLDLGLVAKAVEHDVDARAREGARNSEPYP